MAAFRKKRLKRELGYPIGLVPCAYGGAPLRWWNPEENGALFTNMLEMLADYDIHPRAVLWYQGEAEGYEDSAQTYLERFAAFVRHTRAALGQPELPFLTVQLNRCMEGPSEKLDRQWGMVREAQRQAWHTLEHVTVVPAADLALYDFIHNASEGNLVVGGTVRPRRAGRMLRARCGLDGAGAGIRGSDCPGHGDGSLFAHPQLAQSLWRARGPAAL